MSRLMYTSTDFDIDAPIYHKTVIDTIAVGNITKISASQDLRSSAPETVVYEIEDQVVAEKDSK